MYLRGAGIIVFTASAAEPESLKLLDEFYPWLEDHFPQRPVTVLLLTKMDAVSECDNIINEVDQWGQEHNMDLIVHVSSKNGTGFQPLKDFLDGLPAPSSHDEYHPCNGGGGGGGCR